MHKKRKKVKTVIVEKFKYDNNNNNNDYGITLAPELLLKLLEFAQTEATSDEQLHSIVTRAHIMSHSDDVECLYMEDYQALITEPFTPAVVPTIEVPVDQTTTM